MSDDNPILRTYSIIELGKLEGSLAGILAGFALTVSILLIERYRPASESGRLLRLSIASFLVALVESLATAFNFLVMGAEIENVPRLAVQLIPTSFALAQSHVYFFLGIALALFEYKWADAMRGFVGTICGTAFFMVGGNIAFSTLWSITAWEGRQALSDLVDSNPRAWILPALALAPAFLIGFRITWPGSCMPSLLKRFFPVSRDPGTLRETWYIRIAIVTLFLITLGSLLASFMSESVPKLMRDNLYWVGSLTVVSYSLATGAAVAFLPRRIICGGNPEDAR